MNFTYIKSIADIGTFINALSSESAYKENQLIFLDTESSDLDFFTATWLLLQIKIGDKIFVFDVPALGKKNITYIVDLIRGSNLPVIGHNIKYDIKVVAYNTGILLTNVYDTFTGELIITNGLSKNRYPSLVELVDKYCSIKISKEERENFFGAKVVTQEMLNYAATDVIYLGEIRNKQLERCTQEKLEKVFDLEMKIIPAVASMELNGIILLAEKWNEVYKESVETAKKTREYLITTMIDDTLSFLRKKKVTAFDVYEFLSIPVKTKTEQRVLESITDLDSIRGSLESTFNPASPKQVLSVLRKVYQLDIENTNEKTINKYLTKHPIIKDIINYREASKRANTYGEDFTKNIHPVTGRVHSEFKQLGAESGRFSSENPNMQNIVALNIYRNCFVATPGFKIIGIDYDQQELRFTARYSKDEVLIEVFNLGEDVHAKTASRLFEIPIERVTGEQRKIGKSLNFAVGYGSSEWGLYKNFDIPLEDGRKYLDDYYNKVYTGLRDFKEVAGKIIWERGYAVTPLGRKRWFVKPTIFSDNREYQKFRARIERELINTIIQGGAADCTKLALLRIFYENPFGDNMRILLQVHDEIVIEAREEIAQDARDFAKNIMLEVEEQFLAGVVPTGVSDYIADMWRK